MAQTKFYESPKYYIVMNRPELSLQKSCIQWMKLQHRNVIVHHSPNGGHRSAIEGAMFKAMGTMPGFPDLFIAEPSGDFHGLFVELKAAKGKLSEKQSDTLTLLASRGYHVAVCKSIEEFMTTVNQYLKK